MKKKKLTIFTPSYNRAYTLPQLFQSIESINLSEIEWLIVDDGSTDDTKLLVERFIADSECDIRYIYQENAGKSTAVNVGVSNAHGEYFVCVDSDDYLTTKAIDGILDAIPSVDNMPNCIGMIAMRGVDENTPVKGVRMPNVEYDTLRGIYDKGYIGDTTLIFKTELLRQFPFPMISNEKFVPEGYIYDQIDEKFNYKIVDKIWTIVEYRDDGYTSNMAKLIFNNPKGHALWYNQSMRKGNIVERLKSAIRYNFVSVIANDKGYVRKANSPILSFCAWLPGRLLASKRRRQIHDKV